VRNIEIFGERELGNALEALFQVRLHAHRVLGLGENFQQLVVGEKKEARKVQTLLFEVPEKKEKNVELKRRLSFFKPFLNALVEALENEFEQVVALVELVQQLVDLDHFQHARVRLRRAHE
jgi:malonyl CoA-acyl carrier protein transacylase